MLVFLQCLAPYLVKVDIGASRSGNRLDNRSHGVDRLNRYVVLKVGMFLWALYSVLSHTEQRVVSTPLSPPGIMSGLMWWREPSYAVPRGTVSLPWRYQAALQRRSFEIAMPVGIGNERHISADRGLWPLHSMAPTWEA